MYENEKSPFFVIDIVKSVNTINDEIIRSKILGSDLLAIFFFLSKSLDDRNSTGFCPPPKYIYTSISEGDLFWLLIIVARVVRVHMPRASEMG